MDGTQRNTTQCFMSFVVVDQEQEEEGTVGAFWFCLLLDLGHRHCGKARWKGAFQPNRMHVIFTGYGIDFDRLQN